MDEEELQKRFTDCVYFLASPLTCKKGFECEYRHSEIARLNPRDCWYWLSGCCFNPDCAFRHPPLEGLKEPYHEPSNLNNAPMEKSHKTNIPCYFYSKGFCNKGEQCSFLHGPADVSITPKPSKPTLTVKNPIPIEKKLSEESKTESVQVKIHQNPPETEKVEHSNTVKEHTQDSDQESSESTDVSESQSEENVSESQSQENVSESQENSSRSNSLGDKEEFVQSESDVFNDQSSGFDVLVEGEETERMGYGFDQDVDFFDGHEEKGEYNIGYDSFYQKSENGYVKERFDEVYEPLEKVESRKSIFCRLSFKKRNVEVFNGKKGGDLREHLKRRKVVEYGFPQGYDGNFRRYPQRKGHVPVNRNRMSLKDRKPQFMKQKRIIKEKGEDVFKGPKSLDEIKEEKRKDGFQGPRSLSEILESKRKVG